MKRPPIHLCSPITCGQPYWRLHINTPWGHLILGHNSRWIGGAA